MYSLHYEQALLVDNDEPSRFVKRIEGTVSKFVGDEDQRIPVGSFAIFIIDVAAVTREQASLFDAFDTDARIFGYYELYGRGYEFKRKVLRAMAVDMTFDLGMLILDRLELDPEHRGDGLGLRVLRWLEHQFRMGCGVVVMKPYPLQFEGGSPEEREDEADFRRRRLGDYDRRFDFALRRLQRHYSKLGFTKVAGTPYMVADPLRQLPTLEDVELNP